MNNDVDNIEFKKIRINKEIFSIYNCDYFEIETVLKILNMNTLPIGIPINNNQIFIRDLTQFIVDNKLEPNINEE